MGKILIVNSTMQPLNGISVPDLSGRVQVNSAPSPVRPGPVNTPNYYPPRQSTSIKGPRLFAPDVTVNYPTLGYEQAIALLSYGGYRISEVLSLAWSDVLPGDRVVVRASKKGRASLAHIQGISELLKQVPPLKRGLNIFRCNYGQVYRKMLQRGYAVQPYKHVNRSVTHSPRRELATSAAAHFSRTVASDLLHHKSLSAISYYVAPDKCEWRIEYINGYFWVYPQYSIYTSVKYPYQCHSGWYLECLTAKGYHNGGGQYHVPPAPDDPCSNPQMQYDQAVTFGNLGPGIWPVYCALTVWYGTDKHYFSKTFTGT